MIILGWIVWGLNVISLFLIPLGIMLDLKPREAYKPSTIVVSYGLRLVSALFILALLWVNLHGHLLWR